MTLNYAEWVDSSIGITEELIPVFERYLLHSLATDASFMGQSCIDALSLNNSSIALGYLKRLGEVGLKCVFVETAREVTDFVEKLGPFPWELDPFFICIRTEKIETMKKIRGLEEYREVAGSAVSDEVEPIVRRRFFEVDSLFRHLRNALAHGCFRLVQDRLFFFDLKQDSQLLSCCAVVPFDVLDRWYEISCSMAKRRL